MINSHMKNSPQQSLRVKVGRIITAFSFFMVVFYSYMLLLLKDSGLRDATHSVLWHESKLFIQAYSEDPEAPLPRSQSLQGFIGADTLPEEIRFVFPPDNRASWHERNGGIFYRFTADEASMSHHHLHVRALPNSNEELFMYYRLSTNKNDVTDIWRNVKQVALLGFVLVIIMLLILRKFINRALSPLTSLSRWIDSIRDERAPQQLPNDIQDDEIGQLARSLFDALQRLNLHNEKERLFLRNASHELRTPIAIIRNTMDVIEHKQKSGHQDIDRLLIRIRRASDTMKAVTEAILWLAVEEYMTPEKTNTDLKQLLIEVIEENKSVIHGQDVDVKLDIDPLGELNIEPTLVRIALDNLVRNAFQHCHRGVINVIAKSDRVIEINNCRYDIEAGSDSEKETSVHTGGFGLGLALVQKIAEKKHWRFDFDIKDELATATLTL